MEVKECRELITYRYGVSSGRPCGNKLHFRLFRGLDLLNKAAVNKAAVNKAAVNKAAVNKAAVNKAAV
ncbi:MAG: hypothetical protein ACJZ8W_04850, partial [Limisphaerales bacterium]